MTPIWKKVEIGALITLAGCVITFYIDWKIDESKEEAVMFDTPSQKVNTIEHAEKLPTTDMKVKLERDVDFQGVVLQKLESLEKQGKQTDSIARLGVFLTNKSVKQNDTLNRQLEHTLEHVDQ